MIILQRFIKASVSRQGRGSRRATSGFGKKESTIDDYVDVDISGAKDRRPEPDHLMTDARRRRFDIVLVARPQSFSAA
jgi:resolvase-like protein